MNVTHFSASETLTPAENAVKIHRIFGWILRLGALVAIILAFGYLMLLNSLATYTFELGELKSRRVEIQKELQKWDIELAIPTSLYALGSSEQVQEMADAGKKMFIEVDKLQVASNK